MTVNYTTLIAAAKVAARDFLRTQKILPHLAKISSLKKGAEDAVKDFNEMIAAGEKRVAVKEFEAAALADAHPLKAERVEAAAKDRADFEEFKKKQTENHETLAKEYAEAIAEHELAVTEWTEGVRLVSKDELNMLTREYIAERIKTSFVEGEYDTTA